MTTKYEVSNICDRCGAISTTTSFSNLEFSRPTKTHPEGWDVVAGWGVCSWDYLLCKKCMKKAHDAFDKFIAKGKPYNREC